MKPTAFNSETDLPPIPFEKSVCEKALVLKTSGLDWTPHMECFVWDSYGKVGVPSPFPGNVYFILIIERMKKRNLEPFEKIPCDLDALYDIALSLLEK